jgi:soluble lytic murein transglycosylase-like protein
VRRTVVILVAATVILAFAGAAHAAQSAKIAALQVALRSKGVYTGAIDGISGPKTRSAVLRLQRSNGIRPTGKIGYATRCKLGKLGMPLLGQRVLSTGRVGWDVASLEFRLRRFGLAQRRIDGQFDAATAAALRRFQQSRGLTPDGIAGVRTIRALARGRTAAARATPLVHVVRPGEGFVVIARRYSVQPVSLARANGLRLTSLLTPGQRLRVPVHTVSARAKPVSPPRPKPKPLVHTVRPGEGFIVIARRYGVRATRLARANGLTLTSVLTPGQHLRIPGRSAAARSAPVRRQARVPRLTHTVATGESFFSIAQAYHVSPWRLARANGISLMATIVPGQRLSLPRGAHLGGAAAPVGRDTVTAAIDRWSGVFGVDPKLARALAWMESGFQEDVVSSAGAIGVMQLLPETWQFVDTVLLGETTSRTYDGNIRAGVRYLRWQLDEFEGNVRLALAGYYQGARAVRERGLFEDTKQYVSVILQLYGSV